MGSDFVLVGGYRRIDGVPAAPVMGTHRRHRPALDLAPNIMCQLLPCRSYGISLINSH